MTSLDSAVDCSRNTLKKDEEPMTENFGMQATTYHGTKDANGLTHEDYMRERDAARSLEYKRYLSQPRPSLWSRLKQVLKTVVFPFPIR